MDQFQSKKLIILNDTIVMPDLYSCLEALTNNTDGDMFDFAIYHHDLETDLWEKEPFYHEPNTA